MQINQFGKFQAYENTCNPKYCSNEDEDGGK